MFFPQVCPHGERDRVRCAAHDYHAMRTDAARQRERGGAGGAAAPLARPGGARGPTKKAAPQPILYQ